jgi:hypothetical protein
VQHLAVGVWRVQRTLVVAVAVVAHVQEELELMDEMVPMGDRRIFDEACLVEF